MNVVVLSVIPFPIGPAITHRLLSYLRGMVDLNHSVKVMCLYPTEKFNNVKNKYIKGVYEFIEYEYTCGTTIIPVNKLIRLYIRIQGVIKALLKGYRLQKEKKIDVILVGSMYSSVFFVFFIFARLFNIKLICDITEYPFVLKINSYFRKITWHFFFNFTIKFFDGIFVPTKALQKYFDQMVHKRTKTALIPVMVKPGKFINNKDNINEFSKYIAYCGDFGNNKDGVSILIDSFKIISEKFKNIKLYLIGDACDVKVMENLRKKVNILNISNRVVFTGRIDHDDMPAYICNATLLALARPANKQAEGGFPSKLGEYLETGNPVVITKVGEISEYLNDGENAFISRPDSADAFAERLDYALSNPELAKQIGLNGQKLIYTKYNYKVQSQKLVDFIRTL